MCYLVRQQQSEAQPGGTLPSPTFDRLRPRWAGAVAATLVAGVAVAAVLVPAANAPDTRDAAAPVAVSTTRTTAPAGTVVEQTAGQVDDGVPTADGGMKSAVAHCHEGL